MPKLTVTDRECSETVIDGKEGFSVMELIRNAGVEDSFALCGGSCSCATCHVYLEEGAFALYPAMSPQENELLDSSDHRQATSRLSCQLPFEQAVGDLRVTIAPLD